MDLESIVLSEINQTKTNTIYHLYVKSKKIQQTSEYNKKKASRCTDMENKLVRTSGEREGGRDDGGKGLRSTNYYV